MAFLQRETLWVNQLSDGVAMLVMDVSGRGVNVLTRQLLDDLDATLDDLARQSAFRLLIFKSGKPGQFLAGADIQELAAIGSAAEAQGYSQRGQELFAKLAAFPLPTAALIDGVCLGGGLELALACDYRLVVDQPATQLGLPEVELGLLPAWGGTHRLPRVVGLERALMMILTGKRVKALDAVRWGLADAVAQADAGPPDFLLDQRKQPRKNLPLRTWRQRLLESTSLGRSLIFRGALRRLQRRLPDDMPAPLEAFEAIRVGLQKDALAGLAQERAAAGRLAVSPACRNLVQLFLGREELRKRAKSTSAEPIRRVGVVGVGVMGAGIAQLAVLKGNQIVIKEADANTLGQGLLRLVGLLTQAVERGVLDREEMRNKLSSINGTITWKGFADLDLVIECISENREAKRELFRLLEENAAPSAALASNTSSLTLAELTEGLKRPEQVAGLHFFNPVHKMPLVEVVRTDRTRPEVVAALCAWAAFLGKTPVVVGDSPGFLVNRVLFPYVHEALVLVGQGVRPALIDEAMRRFGMVMGPLELLDHVGMDVAGDIVRALEGRWSARFPLAGCLSHFQANGWLGIKKNLGMYQYRRGRAKPHEAAASLLQVEARRLGLPALEVAAPAEMMANARERLIPLLVKEAEACHAEHLVTDAATLNLALVLGGAWPAHRAGPVRHQMDEA